jgi:pyruvate/2-oxoglutarate dehydrogenase complex dihydrolipoamide acyltransferase (E2) component
VRREILIPQLGLMESATIVEWLKKPGERVARGEELAVVATDKVSVNIESPGDGVLEIALPASPDPVPAESVLGYVDDEVPPA